MLTLGFTGDVMLGRGVDLAMQAAGPAYPWGDALPVLAEADLRLINLECVISESGRPWMRPPKAFHFRARPQAIETLKIAGIDYVSLANNHTLDFEEEALIETVQRLDAAGIAHTGAGRNRQEARSPAILEAKGTRVGVLSYTDNEPDWAATDETPGTNYTAVDVDPRNLQPIRQAVSGLRERVDVVVFSIHWGPNMIRYPREHFRSFARAVIDAGVDIYHGHSSHIYQGIELHKGKLIMYDTGDFVDDYMVDPVERNDQSFFFKVMLEDNRLAGVELVPVLISDYRVNLATGVDADEAIERMEQLCRGMGTTTGRAEQRLAVAA